MTGANGAAAFDMWSEWIFKHRHGNDPVHESRLLERIHRVVDRALDASQLQTGMTLLDVGAGDGVLALRAIDRLGSGLQSFSLTSPPPCSRAPRPSPVSLLHEWKSAQFPDTVEAMRRHPLVNFSERDLLEHVRLAGFEHIHFNRTSPS